MNVSTKHILSMLDKLQNDRYRSPRSYNRLKRIDFEFQSLKHSAIDEIKSFLIEHKELDPISAVEEFRYMMDNFACKAQNGSANFMFSVYYDVATDVLDILLSL